MSDTEELRNRAKQEAQERERQLNLPRANLQGVVERPQSLRLPVETPCFKIQKLVLEVPDQVSAEAHRHGASTLPMDRFRFAQDFLDQYAGQCIGKEGINIMLKGLTAEILERGYSTTRLGVLEQDMSGGSFKFTLIPGLIHEIRFADKETTGTWKNAFPTSAGKLLNLRDIEQGLEQMKRVTSQDVDMQIVPASALGESDVVVSVKRTKPWKIIATLDDSGTKGTGKAQAGLTLGWDNLFGINDLFTFGTSSDAEHDSPAKGTQGYNTSYSIPYGYWTLTLSASDYQYHQRVIGINQTFVSSGNAQNYESKIGYLFYRDQMQKNTLQFRTGRRWSHSFIDDTEVGVQYRNTSYAELALIHKHYIGQSQLDVTVAYRWGAPWIDSQRDPANLPDTSPKLNYQLETIDATLSTPFKVLNKPLNYTVTFRAQNSNSPLYASEWFSIGNRWTVRGFDGESMLGAENGYFLRNEVGIPIADTTQTVYVGLDYGKVYGDNMPNLIGDQLAGAVLGMRGVLTKGMSYDIFAGAPLYKPEGFRTEGTAAGFSLNYQI